MAEASSLDQAAFRYLARQAGLPDDPTHLAELFPYVRNALASIRSLQDIDVTGAEPPLAFRSEPQ